MNLFNIGLLNKENRIHGFSLAVDYAVSLAYIAENQGNTFVASWLLLVPAF